jgi:hypothetical protein
MVTHDIHDLPLSEWGELPTVLEGSVVEVEIVCAHPFGLGIKVLALNAYGHVNAPEATDGHYTVEVASTWIGDVRSASVLGVSPGRQPTLTIRPSRVPSSC